MGFHLYFEAPSPAPGRLLPLLITGFDVVVSGTLTSIADVALPLVFCDLTMAQWSEGENKIK